MPREAGPERKHFGGENGLIHESGPGYDKYFWKCVHCGWQLGGKVFPNGKARIHLSGDNLLRNGSIAKVCDKAPEAVQKKFATICRAKFAAKEAELLCRKRAAALLQAEKFGSPAKQTKLGFRTKQELPDEAVNLYWAKAVFGLDIASNKIDKDFFREAIEATKCARDKYVNVSTPNVS